MNKCIEDLGMLAYSTGHTLERKEDAQGLYCSTCKRFFHKLYSIRQGEWGCPNCIIDIILDSIKS